MTIRQRQYNTPGNALGFAMGNLDRQIQEAATQMREDANRLRTEGNYSLTDPWPMLQEIGEFAEDTARETWADVRDTYGVGVQLVNQIHTLLSSQCEDKWDILIETALPAAGEAIWLLLVPSPGEILEEYLQPKKLKSAGRGARSNDKTRRRKGKNKRYRRGWPRIPNPDAAIAALLPGSKLVKGRNAGSLQRWIFEGIDVVDRVLWYYLILDATDTFITVWHTGLLEARFCSAEALSIGKITYSEELSTGFQFPQDTDPPEPNKNWIYNGGAVWHTDGGQSYTATAGSAILDAKVTKINAPDPSQVSITWDFDLYDANDNRIARDRHQLVTPDESQIPWSFQASLDLTGGQYIQLRYGTYPANTPLDWEFSFSGFANNQ